MFRTFKIDLDLEKIFQYFYTYLSTKVFKSDFYFIQKCL